MKAIWMQQTSGVLTLLLALSGCVTVPAEGTGPDIDQAVRDRVAAGMEYLKDDQPSDARRHFSRALELDDDSAMAHNAMALLYRYEGDAELEEEHYREALSINDDYSTARNNLGIMLHREGRYEEAAEQFRRAAEDPDYDSRANAFANLGETLLSAGKTDEAEQALHRATRLNSSNMRARMQLARLHFKQDNFRRAYRYYRQYVDAVETQSASALWLGIRLAHELDNKDDQSSYELALKRLYPESDQYRQWRDWQGKLEEPGRIKSGENG